MFHHKNIRNIKTKEPQKGEDKVLRAFLPFFCVAALALLAFAGYMFVTELMDYKKSSSLYENTDKEYVVKNNEGEDSEETINEGLGWQDLVDVDISALCLENDDIIGWIYFENIDISYPILYSGDNSTYLRKTYTGEYSSAGSIFMEGKNSKDFSDVHTIIYGHDMKDDTMFGRLKNYVTDGGYVEDHEYFQIVTEKEKYRYKIFSYKIVEDDSEVYTIYKGGSQDFLTFVKENIQNGSFYDACETIKYDDHLITLSTCFNDDRFVVTAVRCDECTTR